MPDSLSAALMCLVSYGYNAKAVNILKKSGWSLQNSFSSLSGLKGKIFKKDDKNNIEYCCAFAGTDTDGVYEFIIDGYNDIINFL